MLCAALAPFMGYASREVVQLHVFMSNAQWWFIPPKGAWWELWCLIFRQMQPVSGCWAQFLSSLSSTWKRAVFFLPCLAWCTDHLWHDSSIYLILRGSFAQRRIYKCFWWGKEKLGKWESEGWGIYPKMPVEGPWFMQVGPATSSCRKVEIALWRESAFPYSSTKISLHRGIYPASGSSGS